MMTRTQGVVKRGLDVVGAIVGLVVLTPLLVLIALTVRLESRGPVLYIDRRLGWHGRPFRLVKFRTMKPDSEPRFNPDGSMRVTDRDDRVTRVGRVLRMGFDELPQLWNVLVGEMSLIGPRPDPLWALERYTAEERTRMEVRPGITGLAQVVGRTEIPWRERLALDVRYVREYSFLLDVRILALTVLEVIPHRHHSRRRAAVDRAGQRPSTP